MRPGSDLDVIVDAELLMYALDVRAGSSIGDVKGVRYFLCLFTAGNEGNDWLMRNSPWMPSPLANQISGCNDT
jgi:hypothetical protein